MMHNLLPVVFFVLAALPLLSQFILYPAILALINRQEKKLHVAAHPMDFLTVDMVIAVRNGQQHIVDKIANCQSLNYPPELLNFIIVSDGSTDETESIVRQVSDPRFKLVVSAEHIGKAKALNMGVLQSQSDVLVFSDTDAMLCPDAIHLLLKKMIEENAAGVCGQRVIKKVSYAPQSVQQKYIDLDSWLKIQESKSGFLTSNDGKLYAVKRQFHNPIADGVTDDLFSLFNILYQKQRFVFEGEAKAYIETPSRNESHEIQRRRRITCRSLNNFRVFNRLLNPRQFGLIAIALIANKVMRRCLPLSIIFIMLATILFAKQSVVFMFLLYCQVAFYLLATYMFFVKPKANHITKIGYSVLYFVLGNIGMFLGMIDFLADKKVTKWEPMKND